jgi:hypothetical protein
MELLTAPACNPRPKIIVQSLLMHTTTSTRRLNWQQKHIIGKSNKSEEGDEEANSAEQGTDKSQGLGTTSTSFKVSRSALWARQITQHKASSKGRRHRPLSRSFAELEE